MRRSIYSSNKIKKNSKILKNTLSILRPRGSLNPVDLNKIIGKTAKINIDSHKIISLKDFKN